LDSSFTRQEKSHHNQAGEKDNTESATDRVAESAVDATLRGGMITASCQ